MRPKTELLARTRASRLLSGLALLVAVASALTLACSDTTRDAPLAKPEDSAEHAGSARPRAIVLFVIDTLRADQLGSYGGPAGLTPHLDALAARGIVFERAHAAAPWTLPSVASLLTSSFPCEHAVVSDGDRIPAASTTLAELLGDAGYRTASVFENPYAGPLSGLDRGFESADQAFDTGLGTGARIDALQPEPLFLYIHITNPHDPYQETQLGPDTGDALGPDERKAINRKLQRFRKLTRADWADKRSVGSTDNSEQQEAAMQKLRDAREEILLLYAKDVARADARLGSVVAAFEQRGLMQDTLFVVVSDHGEEFDDHGSWQHDQSVYEELLRVPLIVHLPRGRAAGTRVATPVSLVDVVPTILDAADLESPASLRGRSLLPLAFADTHDAEPPLRVTGMRLNRKKFSRSVREARGERNVVARQGPWKSIWNTDRDHTELYDLENDPSEDHDLAGENPERAAAMQRASASWLEACRPAREPDGDAELPELNAQQRERLRALGYID